MTTEYHYATGDITLTKPKQAIAIRHLAFEDLGTLKVTLGHHHYQLTYLDAGIDDLTQIPLRELDLLIILGGPIGAYEEDHYPFLLDELRLLETRFQANLPVLGICLGAQIMARALGASVYPSGIKELGWSPIQLTAAGQQSALRFLAPEQTPVLHWHGDTFDLPEGATLLASTAQCQQQAFVWGDRSLGLQFHPEVTAQGLERWFIGHALEISTTTGVSVSQLRMDTQRYAEQLQRQAQHLWSEWLLAIG